MRACECACVRVFFFLIYRRVSERRGVFEIFFSRIFFIHVAFAVAEHVTKPAAHDSFAGAERSERAQFFFFVGFTAVELIKTRRYARPLFASVFVFREKRRVGVRLVDATREHSSEYYYIQQTLPIKLTLREPCLL